MSISRIAGAVALTALLASPVRSAEPLQPVGKWTIDFGDAHCIAMRSYGTADKPITLAFKPSPIGDVMQLSVLRAGGSKDLNQYRASLTIDQSTEIQVTSLGYPAADGKLRVTAINLTPANYDPVRKARSLRVRSSGEVDVALALSQMDSVAGALDTCVRDLRKHWNLEGNATLKQPATSRQPLHDLFSSNDYPAVALQNDGTGSVQVMLLINETGRIASCMVIETSSFASLDAQTCIILTRRARFDAAIGADGQPAKSGALARINWKMRR